MQKNALQKIKNFTAETDMLKDCSVIILGVSGGPDSMAMLHIMNQLKEKKGYRIQVVHVNHGIRGTEAMRDQKIVESVCREWKVPCSVYSYDVPGLAEKWKMGEEETGRKVRRIAFEEEKKKIQTYLMKN